MEMPEYAEITESKLNMTPGTSTRGWPDARATDGVIAVMLTVTALWIAFGHFQFGQHADSLIPVLVSLQHWTPYYWAQDRYGMLIPLLTAPLHNPLTNMMVQSAIGIFAAMSAGFFLVQYFFQDSPIWLVAAALQNIWILLLVSKVVQFELFVDLPYAPSMALGFAALVVGVPRAPGSFAALNAPELLAKCWSDCCITANRAVSASYYETTARPC